MKIAWLVLSFLVLTAFVFKARAVETEPIPIVVSVQKPIAKINPKTMEVTYEPGYKCEDLIPVLLAELARKENANKKPEVKSAPPKKIEKK